MSDDAPKRASIQVALTPEQQALIARLSGQQAEFLELTPEPESPDAGTGEGLRFNWRLSAATGIPRQVWKSDDEDSKKPSR